MSIDTPPRAVPGTVGGRLLPAVDRLFGLVFCLIVALNFAAAAGRYVVGFSVPGGDEIQVYAMVWLIFLGAALASWRRAHLRMDLLVGRLSRRTARLRDLAESVLTIVVCGTMAVVSARFGWRMGEMGQRSDGAGIPMWLPHASAAVGFTLMTAVALAGMVSVRLRGGHST